jgi:hypothetical protein
LLERGKHCGYTESAILELSVTLHGADKPPKSPACLGSARDAAQRRPQLQRQSKHDIEAIVVSPTQREPLAFKNPNNKAAIIKRLDALIAEWRAWQKEVEQLGDDPHDPFLPKPGNIGADGEENIEKHRILQAKTLEFLDQTITGHGFISGRDGTKIDRTDLRLKIRVKHRIADLDELRACLEEVGDAHQPVTAPVGHQPGVVASLEHYNTIIDGILSRFTKTHEGIFINQEDDRTLRQLVLELRDLFDDEFVDGRRHSEPLIRAFSDCISNYVGSPSYQGVQNIKAVVGSALARVQRNPGAPKTAAKTASQPLPSLRSQSRPANHLLLLGAGFSRNWNAPVASEVASSLVQQVGDDAVLRGLLTRYEKNYEDALAEVQGHYLSARTSPEVKARLERLQSCIETMFNRLNSTFEAMSEFEFMTDVSNNGAFSIATYLAKFAAIFTLNQDLLIELRYEDAFPVGTRWSGMEIPGVQPVADSTILGIGDKCKRRWKPATTPFKLAGNMQPYFKLHGSSNWYTDDGESLLVMGANKDLFINRYPVLHWYFNTFRWYLSYPNTKLMVIGYGFGDRHINDEIVTAWRNGTLTGIFVVDLQGRGVLNPTRYLPMPMHSDLEDIPNLGSSTRALSAIFAGDAFEHQKFNDFFNP